MSGLVLNQYYGPGHRRGMGQYAQIIGQILGPLVEGGVSAYGIHQQSQFSEDELKQRQVEFQKQQELAQKALEAQERQQVLAQQAAIQQAQAAQAFLGRNMPYVLGGLALLSLAVVGTALVRR